MQRVQIQFAAGGTITVESGGDDRAPTFGSGSPRRRRLPELRSLSEDLAGLLEDDDAPAPATPKRKVTPNQRKRRK